MKVKGETAKLEKKTSGPKVYMTVKEVKPTAKVAKPTPASAASAATAVALDVNHNTVYLTSKPVQGTEEITTTVSMPSAHYSATIR